MMKWLKKRLEQNLNDFTLNNFMASVLTISAICIFKGNEYAGIGVFHWSTILFILDYVVAMKLFKTNRKR